MGLSSSRVPATLNHPQAKYVQQAVAQNCVVIFSKTTCPFCVQTKEIFRNLGVPYEAVELNNHPNGQDIQNYLGEVTKAKTVSIINHRFIFFNQMCMYVTRQDKDLWTQCTSPRLANQIVWSSPSCQWVQETFGRFFDNSRI